MRQTTRIKRWVVMGSLWLGVLTGSTTVYAQQPPSERARAIEAASSRPERKRARPESYGAMLLKMMLGVMCITGLAYVVIRYGLKRFLPGAQQHGAMQVLLRQPIEPKRSLLMVRVASRHLLLASSESGITLLTELTDEDVAQMLGTKDEPVQKPQISREFSLELEEPTS